MISADGGKPRQITSGNFLNAMPFWSHDGRWIYFCSNRDGVGTGAVWRMPTAGGPAARISPNSGCWFPIETPDGKSIYYLKTELPGPLLRCSAEGGAAEEIMANVKSFDVGAKGVYFVAQDDVQTIKLLPFGSHTVETIGEHDFSVTNTGALSVSRDETYILCQKLEHANDDLMLVENFR